MAAKKKAKKTVKAKKAKKAKKAPAKKAKKTSRKAAKRPAKKAAKKSSKKTVRAAAKKAPAKKARKKARAKSKNMGEGDYAASRRFDKDEASFVEKHKASIPAMGKAAEKALDGPEGASLREAEAAAAGRSRDIFGA